MSSPKKALIGVIVFTLVVGGFLVMVPVLVLVGLGAARAAACDSGALPGEYKGPPVASLSPLQMQRAASVVATGRQMKIPDQGIVVALAVASQESKFLVYANDGKGGDLEPEQRGVSASMNMPHDKVGSDHGSVGVFQQQFPWWGTLAELMDPVTSAKKFYEALLKVGGWESMPVTVAAQRVQRSAFPSAYADDEQLARQLLTALASATSTPTGTDAPTTDEQLINGVYVGGFTDCAITSGVSAATGDVAFPLPTGSGYVNQNNFGRSGGRWSSKHTGNDYSVACGTPVFAATGGVVQFDSSQAGWAGPNFVRISTGPGKLTTWYAHMQTRTVRSGQTVTAGQKIGTVGTLGNSSGCHLHFEVHPSGGSIYEDPVDPVKWLADNAGKTVTADSTSSGGSVRSAVTFNVLGGDKTGPGSGKPSFPSGAVRARKLASLVNASTADLIAFQELQASQRKVLNPRIKGWKFARADARHLYWRTSNYALVSTRSFTIPHYGGKPRDQLVVVLKDRSTGQQVSVIVVHNPADNCSTCQGNNAAKRAQALKAELGVVRAERAAGRAVLLMGDLNDRRPAFCALTRDSLMVASAGGSNSADRCVLPPAAGIDWIFGAGIAFTGHRSDRSVIRQEISDHPWVSTNFAIGSTVAGPPAGDGVASVVSYNVGGINDPGALAQEISAAGATVAVLQDVDQGNPGSARQLKAVAAQLRMMYAYTFNGVGRGRRIDTAILSKHPIVDADRVDLPLAGTPRGLLMAAVDLGEPGFLDVYGTHVDAPAQQLDRVASRLRSSDCDAVLGMSGSARQLQGLRDPFTAGMGFGSGATVPMGSPSRREDSIQVDRDVEILDALVLPAGVGAHRGLRGTLKISEDGCS